MELISSVTLRILVLALVGCASSSPRTSHTERTTSVQEVVDFLNAHYPDLRSYADKSETGEAFHGWSGQIEMLLTAAFEAWEVWETNSMDERQQWCLPNDEHIFFDYSVDHWRLSCSVATGKVVPDPRTRVVFILDEQDARTWLRLYQNKRRQRTGGSSWMANEGRPAIRLRQASRARAGCRDCGLNEHGTNPKSECQRES